MNYRFVECCKVVLVVKLIILQIMESGSESGSELPVIPISTKLTKPVKQVVYYSCMVFLL